MLIHKMLALLSVVVALSLIGDQSVVRSHSDGTAGHALYVPLIAKAAPLQLEHVRVVTMRGGGVRIAGEVVNISSTPLYSVVLAVELYPQTPKAVTVTGTTLLPAVVPGQPNLFVIDVSSAFADGGPFEPTIQSWQEHSPVDYQAVMPVSANICDVNDFFNRFCIELRNDQARELREIQALVWSERGGEYQLWSPPRDFVLAPGDTVMLRVDPPFYLQGWPTSTRAVVQAVQAP